MVDSAVLGYMDAMYSENANYTNEAHDGMGICGYPMGIQMQIKKCLGKMHYAFFTRRRG